MLRIHNDYREQNSTKHHEIRSDHNVSMDLDQRMLSNGPMNHSTIEQQKMTKI